MSEDLSGQFYRAVTWGIMVIYLGCTKATKKRFFFVYESRGSENIFEDGKVVRRFQYPQNYRSQVTHSHLHKIAKVLQCFPVTITVESIYS